MNLSPRAKTMALYALCCFIAVTTGTAAVGVDPFMSSVPLSQPIAKATK
jgi:hypothetical protein